MDRSSSGHGSSHGSRLGRHEHQQRCCGSCSCRGPRQSLGGPETSPHGCFSAEESSCGTPHSHRLPSHTPPCPCPRPGPGSLPPASASASASAWVLPWAVALALCSCPSPAECGIVEVWLVVGNLTLDPTCLSPRVSVVFNNSWPGPTIYASDGDILRVKVYNNQTLPISIHWHGIEQKGSQWYDGVPGVTQCEIKYRTSYTHVFQVRGQFGTFWYHSHVAQLRNTLHGALIIRPPPNVDPIGVPIAGEFILEGGDWFNESPVQLTNDITKPDATGKVPGYPLPVLMHINGRSLCTGIQYFRVARGSWYRLRIINTAMWGSFNLKIEGHPFVLHEAEGGFLAHRTLTNLDVYPGQSYSVLLPANKKPGNYWIVLNPIYDVENGVKTRGLAVLTYRGVAASIPGSAIPAAPTALEKTQSGPLFQAGLTAAYLNQELLGLRVDRLIVLEINLHTKKTTQQQVYSMNNVSLAGGSMPFLLADYRGLGSSVYTSTPIRPPASLASVNDGPTNVLPGVIRIPYGETVQIVFQNHPTPNGMHPWHLHGYNFYVVAQGSGRFVSAKWQSYKYNLRNPPYRNTVAMFNDQWVAIRFRALNPGQWILHCHLEQHADQGLATVLKVEYPTAKQPVNPRPLPLTAPPADYPKC